jgi:hypothetical protein
MAIDETTNSEFKSIDPESEEVSIPIPVELEKPF